MDKAILKKFAIESRQDLMDKIRNKIKTFYVDEDFHNEQKGEVYVLSNDKHSLSLTNEEFKKRELLIKRIKELSLEQVIEEAAYTWFNRIIAIRYMEINDMLPLTKDNQSLGIRVLSSKDNTPDPEILKFTNLMNPELDIDFKKEKFAELKDENEKFKYVLLLICKKLGRVIPQVFDGITDYIDILIPDNLLNDAGFITKVINDIPENNFNQVEIIGWLYQFYISEKKDEVFSGLKNNNKITKENIPAATQLFTPDWVVKYMVENSIGRLWIENNKSSLKDNWKYYIDSEDVIKKENIDICSIKVIDPCSGSGHILVYMFEILYQIYESLGYKKEDIPKMIIENNLNGLDIDDRAGQLSILSVLLKAREYDKKIFNKKIKINILSIQESNSLDRNALVLIKGNDFDIDETIDYVYEKFIDAKEYGSLLKVEKRDYNKVIEIINYFNHKQLNLIELAQLKEINDKYLPLLEQAILLSQKYDSVITNPPYMGQSGMNRKLVEYLKNEYNVSKSDLFAIFIDVALNMTKENRYTSMITMQTWMFLSSYINVRERILFNNEIINMVHLGAGAFEELNAFNVLTSMFVIKNNECDNSRKGTFVRLNKIYNSTEKEIEFFNKQLYYKVNQEDFKKMPNYIIGYWISNKMKNILISDNTMEKVSPPRTGMMTSDNKKFLRFWYEINFDDIGFGCKSIEESIESNKKWFPYIKGGNFRRWYGNRENVVNWFNAGEDIKKNGMTSFRGKDFYFKEGITWSIFGFENFCARYSPIGSLFDIAGTSTFPTKKDFYLILGLLNSKIAYEILILLNPSVNFQNGDIKKIPIVTLSDEKREKINEIVEKNIELSKNDWDSFETSWDFKQHPLIPCGITYKDDLYLKTLFENWKEESEFNFNKLKKNEEEINKIFIEVYGLQEELTPEIEDKDITIRKADREREIKSLISYAVGCMFGRYSLDKDGLIYAGGEFDINRYKTFKADNDNIIPITDEAYFSDDIVERFKTFIKTVYGDNKFNENMDFIAETLGKKGTETSEETIRRYFVNDFFNEHVKMYQKRPIYWLLDSGKKNGFKALIYMHRYNENLIPKARLDYLHRIQTTYEKLLSDVNYKLTTDLSMTDKKEAKNRQTDLMAKLQEIKEYDEKIAHIANQRISINLDDDVKTNYEKFKDILAKIK